MGTFCTNTSILTKGIGIDNTTTNTDVIDECIAQAEDFIKCALSKRYDISADYFQTTTSTPPLITTLCEQYALGLFYEDNARGGKDSYVRADRYLDRVEKKLMKIANGDLDLSDTSGSIITEKANNNFAITSSSTDYTPTFDEDDSLLWEVDEDKLDAIESNRS